MKNYIAIACAVLSIATSCSSIQTLTFDQLNPALQANFPPSAKRIGIVNNMPQIPDAPNNLLTLEATEGDGVQSTTALATTLADSKYFDEVIICDSALNQNKIAKDSDEYLGHSLTQNEVSELCQSLNTDMLLSLERTLISKERTFVHYPGMQERIPTLRVKATPIISLYVPSRKKPMQIISVTDSLDWTLDNAPSDKELLNEISLFSAHILSQQLVPYWSKTSRIYYSGGSAEMRDAAVCVREQDWNSAEAIWKSVFGKSKSTKTKMRTAFNIALAHEMTGDLTGAEKWLDTAQSFITDSNSKAEWQYYSALLKERISKFTHVKSQMNRFDSTF